MTTSTRRSDLDLVLGASGYIGTQLVPRLVAQGRSIRAAGRHPEVLAARGWRDVDIVRADALNESSLNAALARVDTAYYLVHSMAAGRGFARLDVEAARNFAAAAAEAGVRRIVYLGGLVPENPRSEHLRSRAKTGDTLRAGAVPVTELRAGMIIGPGSAAWEVMRDLVNHLPVMITPRWVRSRSTPIALEDLLWYLVRVAAHEETAGMILDVGGPDIVSYEEIMRCYAAQAGRHPKILAVPVLTPRLSSYWLRLVTSVPTNVARALIDGLEHDVIADDVAIRALIPCERRTLAQSIRIAIGADRMHDLPARWTDTTIACRTFRPQYSYYAKRAGADVETTLPAAALWPVVTAFGGTHGYYYSDVLWHVRRGIDWCLGGPSFRRGRRHPVDVRVGDVIDSWRVIALEPERRMTLLMEMKAPGAGVLEFEIADLGERRRLSATAYWHPAGVWGLLYWYPLIPAHLFLFKGLVRSIVQRAGRARGAPAESTYSSSSSGGSGLRWPK